MQSLILDKTSGSLLLIEIKIIDDSAILKYIVSAYREEDISPIKIPIASAVAHFNLSEMTHEKEKEIILDLINLIYDKLAK